MNTRKATYYVLRSNIDGKVVDIYRMNTLADAELDGQRWEAGEWVYDNLVVGYVMDLAVEELSEEEANVLIEAGHV